MPAALPDGLPAPVDGRLPSTALAGLGSRDFGIYVHVPFCSTRCGYCDFTTYTAAELGPGVSRDSYARTAVAEVRLARRVLGGDELPVGTVFVGGGTPTLLSPGDLGVILSVIDGEFGLAPDVEVTTEANPETLSPPVLDGLLAAGFTRLSLGMQSAREHVLATLDRVHTPHRAIDVARWARTAGFSHLNLDLIYGTPGEDAEDWQASLDSALDARPDHVSAYALQVEPGTRLAAQVRRGEILAPDDDVLADRYEQAERAFVAAGLTWYEVSNWATEQGRCRHNQGYWRGADWWGVGPGAHSHIGGVRWWNVRHPAAYAECLRSGRSPAAGRELLTEEQRRTETVLLGLRMAEGLDLRVLDDTGRRAAHQAGVDGLLDVVALAEEDGRGRAALTLRGRLLADGVVRALLGN